MHTYTVNASLQVLPVVNDKHPYRWVDEAIEVIKQGKVKYDVGPFATVLEGRYDEVMAVINDVNEYLFRQQCNEWILSVQIQVRSNGAITAAEKTGKHKQG